MIRYKDIYEAALAVVSHKIGDNAEWDSLAPQWMNMCLAETLNTENGLRMYYKRTPFEAAPRVCDMECCLPYHERLYGALVELMAAFLWTDQDEGYKAQDCRNRAAAELQDCMKLRPERVRDLY